MAPARDILFGNSAIILLELASVMPIWLFLRELGSAVLLMFEARG